MTPHELSWYDGSHGAGSEPGNAGVSEIQPLLSNMTAYTNSNDIAKDRVKVSVLATAGMRIVDTSTASVIYQNVNVKEPYLRTS